MELRVATKLCWGSAHGTVLRVRAEDVVMPISTKFGLGTQFFKLEMHLEDTLV